MTRLELLQTLVRQARANGFEFRKWYVAKLGLTWANFETAIELLATERRYYALIFSHEFAQSFWKPGDKITFVVPNTTFTRRKKDGTIMHVTRKAYTRRSGRTDVWRYHLQQLSMAEEPLRYLRRYLIVEEHLVDNGLLTDDDEAESAAAPTPATKSNATRKRPGM
ncbi:MAG: hypothetical protein ACYC46_13885 [Acidobacteriaceae bacterium]